MAVWTTPITDRTAEDVAYAKANQHLATDLKGAFNVSDANRIIDNSIYLRDLLQSWGYKVSFTDQPHFTVTDLPYITTKMKVMRDNVKALVDAFYSSGNPVISYSDAPTYTGVNNLEINLSITNTLLENMIATLLKCGEGICGNSINL